MTTKEIIDGLQRDIELTLFDPMTGETIDRKFLDGLNRQSLETLESAKNFIEEHTVEENHCVCCGAVIPKGGQVCKQCEKKYEIRWGDSIIQAVYKKGFKDGQYDLIQTLIDRYEMPEDSKLKEILCKQNERKQGHWLVYRRAVKCSICEALTPHLSPHLSEKPGFQYCPHCGARMLSEETT